MEDSLKQLNGNPAFEMFIDVVWELRESAVKSACTQGVTGNPSLVTGALGEISAYEDILSIVAQYISDTD
jgi:transaldolase